MFSKYFKVAIAVMLSVVIAVMSCVSFDAMSIENDDKSIIIYDETIELADNEVYFCTYNISDNYSWSVYLQSKDADRENTEKIWGKDCIDEPKSLYVNPDVEYHVLHKAVFGAAMSSKYLLKTFSGTYTKVRYKLSNLRVFNEDGSCTKNGIDYYFYEDQFVDGGRYSGNLIVVSGGVVNFVAPDKDGYVEFYVASDIGSNVHMDTNFMILEGSNLTVGGGYSIETYDLTKGIVNDDNKIRIFYATLIQRHIAKMHDFVGIENYRADVNSDGEIDIFDATLIQMYLAKQ